MSIFATNLTTVFALMIISLTVEIFGKHTRRNRANNTKKKDLDNKNFKQSRENMAWLSWSVNKT